MHVQKLVSVVKMTTLLEECTTEKQRNLVRFFCGQKNSMQRTFINTLLCLLREMSVCRLKRFTTGSRNSLTDVSNSQMMADQVRQWLRQQSKELPCCEFRRTGKAMGQVYQCWWRIYREILFLFRFEYRVFYVL
jgi:hypothetical protein